jgi:hypothetical protein
VENFHHLATQKRGAARLVLSIFWKISPKITIILRGKKLKSPYLVDHGFLHLASVRIPQQTLQFSLSVL